MYPVSPLKEFTFYEITTLPGNYIINPRDEIEPSFTKYSLAPAHKRYIRGLLSETEWNGGWFDKGRPIRNTLYQTT